MKKQALPFVHIVSVDLLHSCTDALRTLASVACQAIRTLAPTFMPLNIHHARVRLSLVDSRSVRDRSGHGAARGTGRTGCRGAP